SELSLVPRQPYARLIGAGAGAAFVSTSVCPGGRLVYRYQTNTSAGTELACDAQHPAALPALATMPSSANATSGVLTGYEAPLTTRIPALANARATAIAARLEGATVHIAVVAEIGCHPSASIALVLGTLDPSTKSFTFGPAVPVADPANIATMPSIEWIASR